MAPPRKKRHASSDLVERILRNATDGTSAPAALHVRPSLPSNAAPNTSQVVADVAVNRDPPAPAVANEAEPIEAAPSLHAPEQTSADAPAAEDASRAEGAGTEAATAAASSAADAAAADAASAAAAALRALESGQHHADAAKRADLVRVVEKRNFAGQEVEMEVEVQAGSKAAQVAQDRAAAASNKSGLDAALANMTGGLLVLPESLSLRWIRNHTTAPCMHDMHGLVE